MKKILLSLISVLFAFGACQSQENRVERKSFDRTLNSLLSHSVNELTVEQVDSMRLSGRLSGRLNDKNTESVTNQQDKVVFLDARAKKEFEVSHIEDAIWVGYDDFSPERVNNLNKESTIVVYCSIGYRSEKIAEQLEELGFSNVSNLYGGLFEWANQEKEVVNELNEPTTKVHAFDRIWGVWLTIDKKNKVY